QVVLEHVPECEAGSGHRVHHLVQPQRGGAHGLEEGPLAGGQSRACLEEPIHGERPVIQGPIEREPDVVGVGAERIVVLVEVDVLIDVRAPELVQGGVVFGAKLLLDEALQLDVRGHAFGPGERRRGALRALAALLVLLPAAARAEVVSPRLRHSGPGPYHPGRRCEVEAPSTGWRALRGTEGYPSIELPVPAPSFTASRMISVRVRWFPLQCSIARRSRS